MTHDERCDEEACHVDCPARQAAVANGWPYRGQPFEPWMVTRLQNFWR